MESDGQTESGLAGRPPLSPLPSTLRCCPRDDTVCTYCGVSYLVLHEIADLEAKILLLEKNQDGEVEWARGALQAACQALVQRELGSARASAESRIQALAEVYDQERAQTREQQRQVLERARAVCESAHKLAERLFPPGEGGGGDGGGDGAAGAAGAAGASLGAVEYLECASRCLAGTLRSTAATADELHAALRRARQAETELVQARVQAVGLQEEAGRGRREAEQAGAALQEARAQAQGLRAQVAELTAQAGRSRDKLRLLTGQAELWRGVARSLEEEKVVQERMLAELREQLRQLRASRPDLPQQREEEEQRRSATEFVSLRGALRESQEEISSLRGQRVALQSALHRLESNAQRSAEERQALADALQSARQSHALESERRRSLQAERGAERGAWQEERSWLVAERARAEAESAALRNTCLTLQVHAEQCTQQCARMEDTVLRQCEERDALLRTLPEPASLRPARQADADAEPSPPGPPTPADVPPPPLMQVHGEARQEEVAASRAAAETPPDPELTSSLLPETSHAAAAAAAFYTGTAIDSAPRALAAAVPVVYALKPPSARPSATSIGRHLLSPPSTIAVQKSVVAQQAPPGAPRVAITLQPSAAATPSTGSSATHLSTTAQRIAAVLQRLQPTTATPAAPPSSTAQRIADALQRPPAPALAPGSLHSPTAQRLASVLQSSSSLPSSGRLSATGQRLAAALQPRAAPTAPVAPVQRRPPEAVRQQDMVFTIEASRPPNARRGGCHGGVAVGGGGRRSKRKARK